MVGIKEKRGPEMKIQSEDKIVHESSDKACYVYKLGQGLYEVRLNGPTHSKIIGRFDMPDEDCEAKERAVSVCDDWQNVLKIIEKYQTSQ